MDPCLGRHTQRNATIYFGPGKSLERFRACLKIPWSPAARDFGCSQGGEVGASPQRAVTAEPTLAAAKRPAARRVFAEKAGWLRCSSVTAPLRGCSLVAPRHPAFSTKTGPHGIFRQALSNPRPAKILAAGNCARRCTSATHAF